MKELIIEQTFDKDGFLTGYEVKGEVVRCKDCVHKYVCPMYGGSQFFCAYGEREEE